MEADSTRGFFISIGIAGSSYVIVSAGMYAIICVSWKEPICSV